MHHVALARIVLDLAWFAVLIVLFHHFWQARTFLLRAKFWLCTKGHITHFEWKKAGHTVWPKIEYSYQVYDKNLSGEYLFLDTTHNHPNSKYARQIAYKVVMAYKNNEEIEVYYDPNDPEQSALDVTLPSKLNQILMLLGMLILVQVGFICYHFLS